MSFSVKLVLHLSKDVVIYFFIIALSSSRSSFSRLSGLDLFFYIQSNNYGGYYQSKLYCTFI